MTEEEKEQQRVGEGLFGQEELATYTQQQLDKFNENLQSGNYNNLNIN